jgi:hypothetical protein
MADTKAVVQADAKSDTRTNVTLAALGAAVLVRFLESHYGIKITADDALEYIAAAMALGHVVITATGPYFNRIFDRFFPPPAEPASQEKVK